MLHGLVSSAAAVVVSAGLLAVPASSPVPSPGVPSSGVPSPSTGRTSSVLGHAVPAGAPVVTRSCGPEPTSAAGWQRLWDAQTGAWSGGDGASSTRLPDGRLLWLFGDTYVGGVDRSGRRSPDTRLVRNSIVVTDGSCVDVVATTHDALPGRSGSWLWPTHAVVVAPGRGTATRLVVLAQRLVRTCPGPWGFRRTGTASVSVSVPWLGVPEVGEVRDLPASDVL